MSIETPPQAVSWSEAEPFGGRRGVKGEDSYEDIDRAYRRWERERGFKTDKLNGYSKNGGKG